jgi:hypothetical protein
MEANRKREVGQLVEAYHQTDNTELDSEKTAIIRELLMEVERLDGGCSCGSARRAG